MAALPVRAFASVRGRDFSTGLKFNSERCMVSGNSHILATMNRRRTCSFVSAVLSSLFISPPDRSTTKATRIHQLVSRYHQMRLFQRFVTGRRARQGSLRAGSGLRGHTNAHSEHAQNEIRNRFPLRTIYGPTGVDAGCYWQSASVVAVLSASDAGGDVCSGTASLPGRPDGIAAPVKYALT